MPKNPDPTAFKDRVKNVRRDSIDFRDRMYEPTLIEVPPRRELAEYRRHKVPILDQGTEGACTGYGLATVVNYLLRTRRQATSRVAVSPDMLYALARRYDEWPGEDYSGSSARGAMKGWHKHGVCATATWSKARRRLTPEVAREAVGNPLGAYYRVNHKDLVAMHCALTEVGILYATANVHAGWQEVDDQGRIPLRDEMLGGHAFAIVAYDEHGFWIQNSWSAQWGLDGFACISYDDWLANASDVWVARLGVPVEQLNYASTAVQYSAQVPRSSALSNLELRPHLISLGNDGILKQDGTFGNDRRDFQTIVQGCAGKEVVLYAHGGLVSEETAVQVLADFLPVFSSAGIYPLAFIWHSDFWTTLVNIIKEALGQRRPEGVLDSAKDFMLDRLDDALEPLARTLGGKAQWDEMKENARFASEKKSGGARLVAEVLAGLQGTGTKVHVIGHSAGSIFHAPLVKLLVAQGVTIESCTLWAPAITVADFKADYLPLIGQGIRQFSLFTLDDQTEQDDNCGKIYNKSLLYLVSNAFEEKPRIPLFRDGVPILGMEKFVKKDAALQALFAGGQAEWILSPDAAKRSTARHHGDFDNDKATVAATLQRITGQTVTDKLFKVRSSTSAARTLRCHLER